MRRSRATSSFLIILGVGLLTGLLFHSIGDAHRPSAQDTEKSLDIRRHANEPLELIDLKLGQRSIKNLITVSRRNGDDRLDTVKFQDIDDWPKRMRIRLRNVSGKTIVGLQAYLYLKPPGSPVLFSVTLRGASGLESTILEPGDVVEALVDDGSWNRTLNRLTQQGWNPNMAAVTFSVGIIAFQDGLQWNKGHMLRRDPDNPNRVIPIEEKGPPGINRAGPDIFRTVVWRTTLRGKSERITLAPRSFQANHRCVFDNGSFTAPHCSNEPQRGLLLFDY